MKHSLPVLRRVPTKTRFKFLLTIALMCASVRHNKCQFTRVPPQKFRHAMRQHRKCCLKFLRILCSLCIVQKNPLVYDYSNLKKEIKNIVQEGSNHRGNLHSSVLAGLKKKTKVAEYKALPQLIRPRCILSVYLH